MSAGRGAFDRVALLVVDVQLDFLPGGALAVPEGDEILAPLRNLLHSDAFPNVVATQDWHPPDHISFASQHSNRQPFETIPLHGRTQTLWPDHCVAGSRGASLAPDLPWERARALVRKGTDRDVDSYSGFRSEVDATGERRPTGLAGYLRECGIDTVYVCGLARDYCVRFTAEDAAALGFRTRVLWNLTRSVAPSNDAALARALTDLKIEVLTGSTRLAGDAP